MAHFRDIIPDLPDDASLTAYDFARAMSSTGMRHSHAHIIAASYWLFNVFLIAKRRKQALTKNPLVGDKFMFRLRDSVAPYNFHLSEQLDKNVGFQMS